ncbi:MAG: S9 family peptidase [Phycisphaeraceae bacterium]|nr:S9 family peptidase [Phycisphaeraceae bacterium]
MAEPPAYPEAPIGDTVDTYHGVSVADPYRWLEDADTPGSRAWINAENALTRSYLSGVPQLEAIKQRLTELWNFERWGTPSKDGGRYFVTRNSGVQNQSPLYVLDSLGAEPRLLLDPNTWKANGTMSLAGFAVSDDGKRLAYGIAESGSDWNVWKVCDVETGKDLPDQLDWVKFSGASWMKDGSGFFYSRYDAPEEGAALKGVNYFQKVYFHALGTDQAADTLFYHRPDQKEWGFGAGVTDDGRYVVITASHGTDPKNRVFYRDLKAKPLGQADEPGAAMPLLTDFDASYDFIDNDGPVFWFKTDLDAPRGRVIGINVNHPERVNWQEIIPQQAETLQGVSTVGGLFHASYLKDARTQVRVFDLKGKHIRDVSLPGIGTASGFGGKRSDTETFYTFSGYTTPGTVYRYDPATGKSEVFRKPSVKFNPDDYETAQVFYTSKDGTRVPMFITAKKGLKKTGSNPTLLYGYGGFNIPLTPSFSPATLVWLEMGGVFAVANIRGGGEYGEEWHQAGTRTRKQNVFDDFISAAEYLIKEKYTSTPRLAIHGGSNGGLLVGACITQRPDLFGAAIPAVGVLDMLRFPKFTIGWAWCSDYGNAETDEAEFKALYAYSPYHNIKKGTCYPATLITTGDHDDRVFPAHSFKFAAALQAAQGCDNPLLIRIETEAGHGAGKPTSKIIEERADMWAFLVRALKFTPTIESSEAAAGK